MYKKNITISDIAEQMGLSKTTISRALSGHGRVPNSTRKRVIEYCDKVGYRPNRIAQGLVKAKTYNLGWLVPVNSMNSELSFFQECLYGLSELASQKNYDILPIFSSNNQDIKHLERVLSNKKVDGIIVSQPLVNDKRIELVKKSGIPMIVIGYCDIDDVTTIDANNKMACEEFTKQVISKSKGSRYAYFEGRTDTVINRIRKNAFIKIVSDYNCSYYRTFDELDLSSVRPLLDVCIKEDIDCIITADDIIYNIIKQSMKNNELKKITLASYYGSDELVENNISTIIYNARVIGYQAGEMLLLKIKGGNIQSKIIDNYTIIV